MNHECDDTAPASPAALRDEAELPRGYWPTLLDRGDGVKGHFCIGRLIKPAEIYWEFWNGGQWRGAGEVFVGREAAQRQLDLIRASAAATPPSTLRPAGDIAVEFIQNFTKIPLDDEAHRELVRIIEAERSSIPSTLSRKAAVTSAAIEIVNALHISVADKSVHDLIELRERIEPIIERCFAAEDES